MAWAASGGARCAGPARAKAGGANVEGDRFALVGGSVWLRPIRSCPRFVAGVFDLILENLTILTLPVKFVYPP